MFDIKHRLSVHFIVVALIVFWFFTSSSYLAQSFGYNFKQYSVEDGLPSSEVYEVLQDKQGFIWVCSDAGVARFDGYDFEIFTTEDGLTDNTIFHIYQDHTGRIWFTGFNKTLCYFEDEEIHPYEYNQTLLDSLPGAEWFRRMSVDSDLTIHFGTNRYGFGQITKEGVLDFTYWNNDSTRQLKRWENGMESIVYGTKCNSEIVNIDEVINVDNWPSDNQILKFSEFIRHGNRLRAQNINDSDFVFLRASFVGGRIGNEHFLRRTNGSPSVVHLFEKGEFWVANYQGGVDIYRSIHDFIEGKPPVNQILEKKSVSYVLLDNNSGIWLAVQNQGLLYLPSQNFETYEFGVEQLANRLSTILVDEQGKLFVGNMAGDLYGVEKGKRPELLLRDAGDEFPVSCIRIFDNKLWLAAKVKRGYNVTKEGVDSSFYYPLVMTGNRFLFSRDSSVWSAGYQEFSRFKDGELLYDSKFKDELIRYNCVFEDNKGEVWTGTMEGLMKFDGSSLIWVDVPEEVDGGSNEQHGSDGFRSVLNNVRVEDIDQLKDGTMVIGTRGKGVLFWKGSNAYFIDEQKGLISNIVNDIHIDNDQDVWVSTTSGMSWLKQNGNRYIIQNIDHHHGLPTKEIVEVGSYLNTIWVATNKGLVSFDKNLQIVNSKAPQLKLKSIKFNEMEVVFDSVMNFAYNHNYFEVSYTGLSYRVAGEILYRYKMEGVDENWQLTTNRILRYASLSPGEYVFKIQAANEDKVWSDVREIQFTISPPFWLTTWFIILMALVLLLAFYLLILFREKRIAKRNHQELLIKQHEHNQIKAELKALRSQMNPHFMFNTLNAIQSFVNHSDMVNASNYISDFSVLMRKVLENSKSNLITIEEEIEMLDLYLKLECLRFENEISYGIQVDNNLDVGMIKIPSMIIQPFVENAIIHGLGPKAEGVKKLIIDFEQSGSHLVCTIEDSGIGRKAAKKIKNKKNLLKKSMGMSITKDRIRLYCKETGNKVLMKIDDLEEGGETKGTKITLHIPI